MSRNLYRYEDIWDAFDQALGAGNSMRMLNNSVKEYWMYSGALKDSNVELCYVVYIIREEEFKFEVRTAHGNRHAQQPEEDVSKYVHANAWAVLTKAREIRDEYIAAGFKLGSPNKAWKMWRRN